MLIEPARCQAIFGQVTDAARALGVADVEAILWRCELFGSPMVPAGISPARNRAPGKPICQARPTIMVVVQSLPRWLR